MSLAEGVVYGYLALVVGIGVAASRRGSGGVGDFVAGERSFGPVVLYFVMGATMFSAYALLGTPQRVVSKGTDVLYVLSYGAVGLVPMFYFGAKVRRIGAKHGYVTQAELLGARFDSRAITAVMGMGALLSFLPYLVIQLKAAGIVMAAVSDWSPNAGAMLVYSVVVVYVVLGGVRGVGWTNVVQGIAMLVVVWVLGLAIPTTLYGGIGPMFDRVVAEHPEHLTLPGPGGATSGGQYTSEIIVSILGFSMWPHIFMKCFTARSAKLVRWSLVLYPSFLFFLVPLIFLGYVAVLEGGPADDTVLLWLVDRVELFPGAAGTAFAFVAFAILAASMSTGDALLHAGGSVLIRDVFVRGTGRTIDDRTEARLMRVAIVGLALVAFGLLHLADRISVVDLLLLGYAVIVQFLPVVIAGLYWRGANRVGALGGLTVGIAVVVLLFALDTVAPDLYAALNPWGLQIGLPALVLNAAVLVTLSLRGRPASDETLRRFELA